mgnify:FL=1|jgi:hypothetical protein
MLLVLTIVPHHHHDGVACIKMERCEKDNLVNDEHTGHAENDMTQGKSCTIETDFVIPQTDNGIKCSVSSSNNPDHIQFFPILYLIADFLLYPAQTIDLKPEYEEHLLLYISAEVSQFHGLRAPPYMPS